MTELKCNNCKELFVATRQYTASTQPTPIHEIARFCPYCGSSSLTVVKEGEMTDTRRTEPAFKLNEVFDVEPEDLVEEEEKPRRSKS